MKFTYDDYRYMIELIKKNGYIITDYHQYKEYSKPCILRHDIDYSIDKAVAFAAMENKLNIRSTYFVLITSDFYNVLSTENRMKLLQIISYGHEVGLHFDETVYSDNNIADHILYERNLLSNLLNADISTVSMHRPSKKVLEDNLIIPGMINTYNDDFFKIFKYVSDSRMNWREDVLNYIETKRYDRLHILTHPFWYGEKEHSMSAILNGFIDNAKEERYTQLDRNIRDLGAALRSE